jgi:hypothetical protein
VNAVLRLVEPELPEVEELDDEALSCIASLDGDDDEESFPTRFASRPKVPKLLDVAELVKASEAAPEHDGEVGYVWTRPERLRPPRPMMSPGPRGKLICVQDRPCVVVSYALPWTRSLPTEVSEVKVTDETLDPAWWRAQLGAVAFSVELYAEGNSTPEGVRSGRRLFTYAADSHPQPVRVELPAELAVQFAGMPYTVAAMPTGRDLEAHGRSVPIVRVSDVGATKLRDALRGAK